MKTLVLSVFLFLAVAVSAQDASVSVRRANLRDMPSTEGKIVTKLHRNDPLEIIEQVGVWYNVRAKGFTGWLHRSTFVFKKY